VSSRKFARISSRSSEEIMANIMFNLGAPISLNQMLPDEAGEPVALPHAIPNTQGLYLILNQNNQQENRYMGISVELRTRFAARQGSCFELGFAKSVLNNIYAYLGTASYQNTGAEDWTPTAWLTSILFWISTRMIWSRFSSKRLNTHGRKAPSPIR